MLDIGETEYDVSKRNRKGKLRGQFIILTRKCLKVETVVMSESDAEMLQVVVCTSIGDQRNFVVIYVPPKTNTTWQKEEYDKLLNDTF